MKTTSLLVVFTVLFLVGCGGGEVEEQVDTSARDYETGETTSEVGDLTVGLSVNDVLKDMPMKFELGEDDDGTVSAMGENKLAKFYFYGDEKNLSQATLATSFKIAGNEEASSMNSLVGTTYFINAFPGEDLTDWVIDVLGKFSEEGEAFEEKVVGDKKLEVFITADGLMFFTVKHANDAETKYFTRPE